MTVDYNGFPGWWDCVHSTAALCDKSPEMRHMFPKWMYHIAKSLPCEKCSNHALAYMERKPPTDHEGYFLWSFIFHNDVNARLKKEKFPYEKAYDRWVKEDYYVCTDC